MATVTSLRTQSLTTSELLKGIKVIDVDTHVSETQDLWTSRAPQKYKNLVPRVVGEGEDRQWVIGEGEFLAGRNAVSLPFARTDSRHAAWNSRAGKFPT